MTDDARCARCILLTEHTKKNAPCSDYFSLLLSALLSLAWFRFSPVPGCCRLLSTFYSLDLALSLAPYPFNNSLSLGDRCLLSSLPTPRRSPVCISERESRTSSSSILGEMAMNKSQLFLAYIAFRVRDAPHPLPCPCPSCPLVFARTICPSPAMRWPK